MGVYSEVKFEVVNLHEVSLNVKKNVPLGEKSQEGVLHLNIDVYWVHDVTLGGEKDLLPQIEEDYILRVVLNPQERLQIVHDVINLVRRVLFDVFTEQVYFDTPQSKCFGLLVILLKEDIDGAISGLRNCEDLELKGFDIVLLL